MTPILPLKHFTTINFFWPQQTFFTPILFIKSNFILPQKLFSFYPSKNFDSKTLCLLQKNMFTLIFFTPDTLLLTPKAFYTNKFNFHPHSKHYFNQPPKILTSPKKFHTPPSIKNKLLHHPKNIFYCLIPKTPHTSPTLDFSYFKTVLANGHIQTDRQTTDRWQTYDRL